MAASAQASIAADTPPTAAPPPIAARSPVPNAPAIGAITIPTAAPIPPTAPPISASLPIFPQSRGAFGFARYCLYASTLAPIAAPITTPARRMGMNSPVDRSGSEDRRHHKCSRSIRPPRNLTDHVANTGRVAGGSIGRDCNAALSRRRNTVCKPERLIDQSNAGFRRSERRIVGAPDN